MLSNIIIMTAMLINGMVVFLAYRTGLKDGQRLKEGKSIPKLINLPTKPPKLTEEQIRLNKIAANIDNYNGTPFGQEEVE